MYLLVASFWSWWSVSARSFWEFFSETGFIFVIIGVIGESSELAVKWHENKGRSDWWLSWLAERLKPKLLPVESIFFALLVLGLAMEFLGSHMVIRIADKESDNSKAKLTHAEEFAAKIGTTNAQLISNNLVLQQRIEEIRWKNLKLEQEMRESKWPRWIKFNEGPFERALQGAPKMDVQIWYPPNDAESYNLVWMELRDALKGAGWNITDERAFVPAHSWEDQRNNPLSIMIGENIDPIELELEPQTWRRTVADIWTQNGIKSAPKALAEAFDKCGICSQEVTPTAKWDVGIPTNTIRIIIFPKNY